MMDTFCLSISHSNITAVYQLYIIHIVVRHVIKFLYVTNVLVCPKGSRLVLVVHGHEIVCPSLQGILFKSYLWLRYIIYRSDDEWSNW